MFQGFFHWDSLDWVQGDQFHEKVKRGFVEVFEVGGDVNGFEFGEGWFEVGQLLDVLPFFGRWGSVELEDFEDLIDLWIAREQGLFLNEFSKNASNGPDIDSQAVLFLSEQHFRGPVPKGLDFMGEGFDWKSKSSC